MNIKRAVSSLAGIAGGVGLLASPVLASPVSASPPLHFGPFTRTFSDIGFNCDGFDVRIESEGTDSFTVFVDDSGEVTKMLYRARYPHDTLTNTVTGKSIVVRAAFNEVVEPVPGSDDEFTKTITGFRYMVNEPGVGVTVRDVGRITYGDLEQTIILWQAGEHQLALETAFEPTFCGALA
jgi:hypothetical protein